MSTPYFSTHTEGSSVVDGLLIRDKVLHCLDFLRGVSLPIHTTRSGSLERYDFAGLPGNLRSVTLGVHIRKAHYKVAYLHALFFSSKIIGSHSSTLFLSGSMIHANFPFSCDSGPDTISTPFCFS